MWYYITIILILGEAFEAVSKLLPEFLAAGGKLNVCSACIKHNGVDENNLVDGIHIIDAEYVVGALMSAKKC